MTNKELAKELLGYTYIDIQKIPKLYKMLNVDIEKLKKEYEQENYESSLSTLAAYLTILFYLWIRWRWYIYLV